MNKEKLLELGLTEEQADKVIEEHKSTLENQFIPKSRFDEVNEKKKTLETQVHERDTALSDLQKQVENKVDKAKVDEIKQQLKDKDKEYDLKLQETNKKLKIVSQIATTVHDSELVVGMLDISSINVDEQGNVIGLHEQIENLKESKGFLFKSEQKAVQKEGIIPSNNIDTTKNNQVTKSIVSPNLIDTVHSPAPVSQVQVARDLAINKMKQRQTNNK